MVGGGDCIFCFGKKEAKIVRRNLGGKKMTTCGGVSHGKERTLYVIHKKGQKLCGSLAGIYGSWIRKQSCGDGQVRLGGFRERLVHGEQRDMDSKVKEWGILVTPHELEKDREHLSFPHIVHVFMGK